MTPAGKPIAQDSPGRATAFVEELDRRIGWQDHEEALHGSADRFRSAAGGKRNADLRDHPKVAYHRCGLYWWKKLYANLRVSEIQRL